MLIVRNLKMRKFYNYNGGSASDYFFSFLFCQIYICWYNKYA